MGNEIAQIMVKTNLNANTEKTFNWTFRDIEYIASSYHESCKILAKQKQDKYFKPVIIFFPLILPSYKKIQFLEKYEFLEMESYSEYRSFLRSIPKNIKILISELSCFQHLALESIFYVEGFEEFLKQEKQNNDNYIITVWSLSQAQLLPFSKRIELAKEAMYCERQKILSDLFDLPCSKRFLKLLNLFPAKSIDKQLIDIVYYFSSNIKLYTALINSRRVKQKIIKKIYYTLPDWLITENIINAITGLPAHINSLSAVFPPAILNAKKHQQKSILMALKNIKTYNSLEDKFASLTQKLKFQEKFPLPPFKGSKRLKAISTGSHLKKEGLRMHNCVAGYIDSVLTKKSYFYHWDNSKKEENQDKNDLKNNEIATVQLSHCGYNKWYLEEALGKNNERLSDSTIKDIKKELLKLMPENKLPLKICHIAGTYYYEAEKQWNNISQDSEIVLQREPENKYDELAIIVFLKVENELFKLGYIPRDENEDLAEQLDTGQKFQVEVLERNNYNDYNEIILLIFITEI